MTMESGGMTYVELVELMEHIEEHYSWKNMYENHCKNPNTPRKVIKYVRFCMDTRSCDIWQVTFDCTSGWDEREVTFRTEVGYALKAKIYEWLDNTPRRKR